MTTNEYTGNIVKKNYQPSGHAIYTQHGWYELEQDDNHKWTKDQQDSIARGFATILSAAIVVALFVIGIAYLYGV